MQSRESRLLAALAVVAMTATACSLDVQMQHEPAVATSGDTITFTAETETSGTVENLEIRMYVAGTLVQSCTSSPCVYTGGPYASFENDWLGYHAEASADISSGGNSGHFTDSDIGFTGITEADYSWKASEGGWYIPVRWSDHTDFNTNVVLQRSLDYDTSFADGLEAFLDDVGDKLIDVLMAKEEIWGNMEDINIYAYRKAGDATTGCGGTLHADTAADMPWATDHGILHVTDFGDCTSGHERFTAEGHTNTQAFLHEFSHSVFELADEYSSASTTYFMTADEPNIFDTETQCRDEQTAKGRNPDDCWQFTSHQGGWWGTHSGTTVMTNGLVTHPWSVESVERLRWWFDNN
jgi:hypothetical protein